MNKYQILTLEVWGNQDDGYEINNQFNYRVIDESEINDFEAFCREHLIGDPKQYEIDSCSTESFFEVRHIETGKPIFHLHLIQE